MILENSVKIIYGLPDVTMALWVLDGRLWRNISGRKIMRERVNRNAQALYLSAGYSDLTRYKLTARAKHLTIVSVSGQFQ